MQPTHAIRATQHEHVGLLDNLVNDQTTLEDTVGVPLNTTSTVLRGLEMLNLTLSLESCWNSSSKCSSSFDHQWPTRSYINNLAQIHQLSDIDM